MKPLLSPKEKEQLQQAVIEALQEAKEELEEEDHHLAVTLYGRHEVIRRV